MQDEIQPSNSTVEMAGLVRKLGKQLEKRGNLEIKLKRKDRQIQDTVRKMAVLTGRRPPRALDLGNVGKIAVEEVDEGGERKGPVKPDNEPPGAGDRVASR